MSYTNFARSPGTSITCCTCGAGICGLLAIWFFLLRCCWLHTGPCSAECCRHCRPLALTRLCHSAWSMYLCPTLPAGSVLILLVPSPVLGCKETGVDLDGPSALPPTFLSSSCLWVWYSSLVCSIWCVRLVACCSTLYRVLPTLSYTRISYAKSMRKNTPPIFT